jgi:glycogen synthase
MNDEKKVRLAYLSGPVDAADVYKRWKAGRHTQLFGTSYLMQFYDLCADIDAELFVITTLPGARGRQKIDNVTIENRAPPTSKGAMYHLAIVAQMLALTLRLFKFRPSGIIITAHQNYWFALALLKLLGTEIIPSAHCVMWRPYAPNPSHWRLLLWLDGLFLRFLVSRAMAISQVVADQLKALAAPSRMDVAIVTPTYARGHFDGIAAADHNRRPFRVLFNGRTEANKGIFDLVTVAGQLQSERPGEFLFDVCGEGTDLSRLREQVEQRGLCDVMKIHGFCDKEKLSRLIATSHVLVVPTRSDFEEGLAKSCVEAVLAGRPFVTSPVCPALLTLAPAGVEARPDDASSYRDALVRLADDADFYRSKAEACEPLQSQFYETGRGYKETLTRQLVASGVLNDNAAAS